MATREESRQPNEVALFRSLDPWYGYGTKPDFDAYFAQHGYSYGEKFGEHNTPSLPYPEYETSTNKSGTYHRGIYGAKFDDKSHYGRYGPHHGAVVGPELLSQHHGGVTLPAGSHGWVAPPEGGEPASPAWVRSQVATQGPHGHRHHAYGGYHAYAGYCYPGYWGGAPFWGGYLGYPAPAAAATATAAPK